MKSNPILTCLTGLLANSSDGKAGKEDCMIFLLMAFVVFSTWGAFELLGPLWGMVFLIVGMCSLSWYAIGQQSDSKHQS